MTREATIPNLANTEDIDPVGWTRELIAEIERFQEFMDDYSLDGLPNLYHQLHVMNCKVSITVMRDMMRYAKANAARERRQPDVGPVRI
jgi:hypothetical protein